MVVCLRVDCTKLKIVFGQMSLTLYRVFFFCFFGVRFLLKDVVLHERIEVIDEGLEVL